MSDYAPDTLDVPAHIQEKRACIAAFMDAHPNFFAPPTNTGNWTGFIEHADAPDEREELILTQATGRIVQVIRSAQDRTPSDFDMKAMLEQASDEGFGNPELDPAVLAIAGAEADADEEVATMARAMTLYKEAIKMGLAGGTELHDTVEASFDALPSETPFMKDLLATAKRIVMIDLDLAMRQAA